MHPKASRAGILLLEVQDLFEERERQLVVGMVGRAGPLIFQAGKAIPLKGRQ